MLSNFLIIENPIVEINSNEENDKAFKIKEKASSSIVNNLRMPKFKPFLNRNGSTPLIPSSKNKKFSLKSTSPLTHR
jgi:hypothetical protein